MKFRINRQEFADNLNAICSVAAARTPKEILKCVRLDAQSDVVILSATDLEISLRCAVTQVEVDSTGETVVVADTLARIVRECSDELLSLETDSSQLHVRGTGSHFQIMTQDASDFPPVPTMDGDADYTIENGVLRRLTEWTVLAAARESTRYAINGVLWEVSDNKLTLAATDGRRLAVAGAPVSISAGRDSIPSAILPVKAMTVLGRLSEADDATVSIKVNSNQMLLGLGGALIGTSLVEGHFPNYHDVIPTDCDQVATLDASSFSVALKQASLLTNEESKGVRVSLSAGEMTISSRAPEQGEATVSIPIEYRDEPLDIGFNPVFLLDLLRVTQAEQITLSVKESNRPGVIRTDEGFIYVVMPVNLSSA